MKLIYLPGHGLHVAPQEIVRVREVRDNPNECDVTLRDSRMVLRVPLPAGTLVLQASDYATLSRDIAIEVAAMVAKRILQESPEWRAMLLREIAKVAPTAEHGCLHCGRHGCPKLGEIINEFQRCADFIPSNKT